MSPHPPPIPAVIYNQALSIANTSTNAGAVLHLAIVEAEGSIKPLIDSKPNRQPLRSAVRAVAGLSLAAIFGCGNTYRPVVTAINPVGPAAQPQKYAVAVSSPSTTSPGLVTLVDFAGDSILVNANLGVNPYYLQVNAGGNTGYTLNSDTTVTSFDISSSLMTNDMLETTLLDNPPANPNSIFPEGTYTYITEPGRNAVAVLTGTPPTLQEELPIPSTFTPVYVAGVASAPRAYAISQRVGGGLGQVNAIENISLPTISNTIPVGSNPVYGIMSGDGRRAFILNQGDGTVSVINAQANALDSFSSPTTGNPTSLIPVGVHPIWADFAPTLNEMAVANAGPTPVSSATPVNGSLSLVSIPLCSAAALPTNPNCDVNNPIDAVGFGTVIASIPVGINPVMVSVLQDGTYAFVANAGDPNLPCAAAPAVPGTSTVCGVSVINLTTNTVVATIPSLPDSKCSTATSFTICGHPSYIIATTGSPTGKVYVVSADSKYMSVIRTDIDTVETVIPLQGNGVSVRITAQ